jgi:hypothetical protein
LCNKKITSNNFFGGWDPFFLSNSAKDFKTTTSTEATAVGEVDESRQLLTAADHNDEIILQRSTLIMMMSSLW